MKIYPLTTSQLTDLNAGELIDRYIKDMINQGIVITTDPEVQELYDKLQQSVFCQILT
jgi:hypothetical protein